MPFDVDEVTLRAACASVRDEFPGLEVHGVAGDFEHHLGYIPTGGTRLFAFLGGTIGNLDPGQRKEFLGALTATMAPGDGLLLGTDLVKDIDRLEAAYDDSQGVTAEFNRNVLRVVNRRLHADFVPERFEHVAFFDTDNEWIEMRLRSVGGQRVTIADLDLTVDFADGEEMRTEISAKFRRSGVETELGSAGLELREWWTDTAGDFALSLSAFV